MTRWRLTAFAAAALLAVAAVPARAQDKLVVDIWGGNWRDGANEAIAKEFETHRDAGRVHHRRHDRPPDQGEDQ